MNPILAAECIEKSFGKKTVLRTAGLWVTPGRITAVLGRNGCGKRSLRVSRTVGTSIHGTLSFPPSATTPTSKNS